MSLMTWKLAYLNHMHAPSKKSQKGHKKSHDKNLQNHKKKKH
jgi:hypothetical protein